MKQQKTVLFHANSQGALRLLVMFFIGIMGNLGIEGGDRHEELHAHVNICIIMYT
jgi:hypothetical protein